MSKKLLIESKVRRLIHWLDDIEKGNIQIPKFQRDFVWDVNAIKDLFDSIKLRYPIGSILLWKPEKESFERRQNIGSFKIPNKSSDYWYILDGFQRLSTIFGCLNDPNKGEKNERLWKEKFNIYYDLETEEFIIPRSDNTVQPYQVPLYQLIDTKKAFYFQLNLNNKNISEKKIEIYMERYSEVGSSLIDYELPAININGGNIKEAVEIFSRVNSKGTEISPDWMISALTYNKDKNFRLGDLIDELLINLEQYNFHTMTNGRNIILKCIAHSFGKAYFDQSNKIEKLAERNDFITVSRKTVKSIEKAVQFLFEKLLVLHAKQLPYIAQLIFITDFFNTLEDPTDKQLDQLKQWFWITTYSNYFTIYPISKQREAYNKFRRYLKGKTNEIIYNDKPLIKFETASFPLKINSGSVRSNALTLFLLNYNHNNIAINRNIEEISLSYLFKDVKNNKNTFYPESVIPIIRYDTDKKTEKFIDITLLEKYGIEADKHFLTDEMIAMLKDNNNKETKLNILEKRKILIIEAERQFVEKLGLDYSQ